MSEDTKSVTENNPPTVPAGIPLLDEMARLPKASEPELIIISGMSGAGRTRASMALEDLDWYVVDNLPPTLLPALAGMMTVDGSGVHRLGAVVDVRSREFFHDLEDVLAKLNEDAVTYRIIFLEADEATLVRRYESNRRPHLFRATGESSTGFVKRNRCSLRFAPVQMRSSTPQKCRYMTSRGTCATSLRVKPTRS